MSKFTLSHVINCDADTFWKLFLDRDFNVEMYTKHLGFPRFEILEQRETETQVTRKVVGEPKMEMPGPVAKLLGSSFSYTEEGVLDKATKVWRWKMTPSTMADKIRQVGTLRVEPAGEGKVRRVADLEMEAKIFGIGGLIESSSEKQLRDGWDKSAVFFNDWIAKHK